jgi:hypothetical protein
LALRTIGVLLIGPVVIAALRVGIVRVSVLTVSLARFPFIAATLVVHIVIIMTVSQPLACFARPAMRVALVVAARLLIGTMFVVSTVRVPRAR